MKTRLLNYWEIIRSSYWFVPALMTILAIGLSFLTIAIDHLAQSEELTRLTWVNTGGADGVRTLLSTLAGSMITMASVTFSITIVALSLASSQFGPRLLNNFMRDPANQVVLGTFIATFVYSLLVLRTVRSVDDNVFVPHISVTVAVLLAVASLGLFIFFIHHVSVSINAQQVIASVERELNGAIERLFPEKKNRFVFEYELRNEGDVPEDFDENAESLAATNSGYIQSIDNDGLMNLATEHDLLLRLEHRPGNFIAAGNGLVSVWPAAKFNEELAERINEAFIVGTQRLRLQDIEFAIDQLVEIALRALSPGINDPFTAMACIDRLGVALAHLAERQIPSGYRYDDEDKLRLMADSVTFESLVATAFDQIRRHGRHDVAVTVRLLETLAVIAAHAQTPAERGVIRQQATIIWHGAQGAIPAEHDRRMIEERYQVVMKNLDAG
jgi:uncharacterized membrane protein